MDSLIIATLLIAHDDNFYLAETIQALQGKVPSFVFVNRLPFHSTVGDLEKAAGVAEAAFFLGVQANRRGAFPEALHWMERALELNPGHGETLAQVQSPQAALGRAA